MQVLKKAGCIMLQWSRGCLPGCNGKRLLMHISSSSFNGAGDASPDVTRVSSMVRKATRKLQWSRGCLPGCNNGMSRQLQQGTRLQWSRGCLPGCNTLSRAWKLARRLLQWSRGCLPGCNGSSVLARPGAACKGMDRRPVVLCPAAGRLPCPLQEKALFFQSGCTSEKGTVF